MQVNLYIYIYICACACVCVCVCIVMKLLRQLNYRRRWQAFSVDPFTYAYRPDNAKRIARIKSDNILFRDAIQPQAKKENYDTENFRTSRKWRRNALFRI